MKALHMIACILLAIGGLNWLLIGINSDWNVVMYLGATLARIVYLLVGISAVYLIFTHKTTCRYCNPAGSQPAM